MIIRKDPCAGRQSYELSVRAAPRGDLPPHPWGWNVLQQEWRSLPGCSGVYPSVHKLRSLFHATPPNWLTKVQRDNDSCNKLYWTWRWSCMVHGWWLWVSYHRNIGLSLLREKLYVNSKMKLLRVANMSSREDGNIPLESYIESQSQADRFSRRRPKTHCL